VPPRSTLAASIDARIADILVEHDHLTRALPHLAAALEQFQEDRDLRGKYEEAERRLRDGPPEERRPLAHAEVPAELSALLDLEPKRERGAIDSYYGDRRFGFIRDDRGVTVFFHASNVQLAPDQEIAVGARVSFVRGINHKNKKSQAEQVRLEIWFPGAGGDPGDPA
jgi:cold shock CspA family protein